MDYNSIKAVVSQIEQQPIPYFSGQLFAAVQMANGGVHNTFFGGANTPVYKQLSGNALLKPKADATMGALSNFSLYYVSFVLSTNTAYGFNSTVANINTGIIQQQIAALSSSGTGDAMFMDYLLNQGLSPAFADTASMQASAEAIATSLGTTKQFDMLITELQHTTGNTSIFPAKVLLYLLNVLDSGGTHFQTVATAWKASQNWSLVADWNSINWFDTVYPDFAQNASQYNLVFQATSSAIQQCSAVTNYKTYCPPCQGGMAGNCPSCHQEENGTTSTYGTGVVNWLNSAGGPSSLGLRSGSGPNNVVTSGGGGGGGGCLLHNTQLLGADGSLIYVQDVRPGMKLLNGHQEVVVTSFETVINPRVDAVYGINSDEPMMSKEHAVMTQRGWCSLNPAESMKLNPHITVKYLKIGDLVWRLQVQPDGSMKKVLEEVTKINHQVYPCGKEKVGYAFTFSNGSRSLWANGFCTLVNYPEITPEKIGYQVAYHMNASQEMRLLKGLRDAGPLLSKAIGNKSYNGIIEMFQSLQHISKQEKKSPMKDLSNLVVPNMNVVVHATESNGAPNQMAVVHGNLFVDGQLMDSHTKGDRLYWTGNDKNGKQQDGVLRFSSNRLSAHGMMQSNGTSTPVSAYTTVDFDTSYGPTNTPWYKFEMGFQLNAQGQKEMYGLLMQADGKPFDAKVVTITFSPTTNKDKQLLMQVDIAFDPTYVAWTGFEWIDATFIFSCDYRSFVGTLYKYDHTQPLNRGQGFTMNGVYTQTNALQSLEQVLRSKQQAQPLDLSMLQASAENAEVPAKFATASSLQDNEHLSVEALYSLTPPDMVQLNKTNFDTLKNLMVYSVPDDLLKWFNETKPGVGPGQPLTQQEANLTQSDTVSQFLNQRFAMGYFSQAFSQAEDPKIKSFYDGIPDWKTKLAYFWQGKGDGCFATDPGYNTATSTIMNANYIAAVPGLAPYLQNDPKGWAQQLYTYCIQPSNINSISAGDAGLVNNLVMMLQALDPDKEVTISTGDKVTYGAALYRAILNVRFGIMKSNPKNDGSNENLTDWLNAFLRQYFEMAENGHPDWDAQTIAAVKQSLEDAYKEYNVSNLNALENSWGDLVASVINVLNESQNFPLTKSIAEWADRNPGKASIFGAAVSFAVFGVATFALVDAALNWDEMSPVEKTQAIVDVAASIAVMFDKYAKYQNALILTRTKAANRWQAAFDLDGEYEWIEMSDVLDNVVVNSPAGTGELDEAMLSTVGENGAKAISAGGGIEEGTAMWTKVANVSSKFAEFMGILALGVACWATGTQIADDFKSGQPPAVKALDILEEAANATCFVIAAGAGIAGLLSIEVASTIPIIGAVVAIVGIIISIILLFVHRNPPESPAEQFVEESIVPWINALTAPTAEWLANYEKAQNHLNGNSLLKLAR